MEAGGKIKNNLMSDKELKVLIKDALKSGATDVSVVSAKDIIASDDLADMCLNPRCENYGVSKSCPPHVSGPSAFRRKLEKFSRALFFKIEVPSEILYSSNRYELFKLLHETAAGIEQNAVNAGFTDASAYAGGSCKNIFCHDFSECCVTSGKGECRNPLHARPSMSGFGINVAKLAETAGWTMNEITHGSKPSKNSMAGIYGLVLIY